MIEIDVARVRCLSDKCLKDYGVDGWEFSPRRGKVYFCPKCQQLTKLKVVSSPIINFLEKMLTNVLNSESFDDALVLVINEIKERGF